jgi:sporulation protein YlmC with PRC-barrel domain
LIINANVWPGKPPTIEAPRPAVVIPTEPAPTLPPTPIEGSPAIVQVPSDVLPIERLRKLNVYDLSNEKVGQIEDVLFGRDGKLAFYIVGVGDWVVGGQGKNIAVPFSAVKFETAMTTTETPSMGATVKYPTATTGAAAPGAKLILYMTKDAMVKAPKQKFDPSAMTWVPDPAAR